MVRSMGDMEDKVCEIDVFGREIFSKTSIRRFPDTTGGRGEDFGIESKKGIPNRMVMDERGSVLECVSPLAQSGDRAALERGSEPLTVRAASDSYGRWRSRWGLPRWAGGRRRKLPEAEG